MGNILRVIIGTKRTGKSTLARAFLESHKPRRLAALDPTAEDYTRLQLWTRVELAQTFALNPETGDFAGRLVPKDVADFHFFCRAVSSVDNLLYCVDEGGMVLEPHVKEKAVYALCTLGGHWGQDGIWITQMPTTLPRVVRSQADEIYFFKMDEKNDLEWCENYLDEEAIGMLPRLPVGSCFKFTRGSVDIELIEVHTTA